jgi:four helix bundle protein
MIKRDAPTRGVFCLRFEVPGLRLFPKFVFLITRADATRITKRYVHLKSFLMTTVTSFEDLKIWQKARALSRRIYTLTFEPPISQDYRFRDQIRGSSGSIMDNIAEGFERSSRLEFINSLSIAKGEAGELRSQLYRGLDIGYFTQTVFNELFHEASDLSKSLYAFIDYLNKSVYKGQKFKGRSKS